MLVTQTVPQYQVTRKLSVQKTSNRSPTPPAGNKPVVRHRARLCKAVLGSHIVDASRTVVTVLTRCPGGEVTPQAKIELSAEPCARYRLGKALGSGAMGDLGMMDRIMKRLLDRPPDPRELASRIPEELSHVIQRAMEVSMDARPASAEEFGAPFARHR